MMDLAHRRSPPRQGRYERMQRKTKWIAGGALAVAIIGGGAGVAVAGDVVGGNDDAPLTGSTLDDATAAALAETGGGTVTDTEHDDGGYEIEIALEDGTEVDVTLDDTFAVVRSETDDEDDDPDDVPLTGTILEQATAAALAETGSGVVTDSEQEANGRYEVEVTLDDGTEVDVYLDDNFQVTATDTDTDTDDDDETDD